MNHVIQTIIINNNIHLVLQNKIILVHCFLLQLIFSMIQNKWAQEALRKEGVPHSIKQEPWVFIELKII